ncbi:MAG: 3-dehydroquinate synthase [Candidatus Rifleibacteriota bacterium]
MESQKLQYSRTTSSEIILGSEIFKEIAARVHRSRTAKKCAIVTNDVVNRWYLQPLVAELRSRGVKADEIIIPDGEKFKTLETAFSIINRLCELEIDKDCPIISLGGGVVGDITGFVASVYKRGIPFIQIPTSLLAMVDACVGGKNGLNLESGKNLIGTFYQPMLTAIDVSVLKTLPLSQLSYGMVEAIKHGAIADAAYIRFILKNTEDIKSRQIGLMQRLIRRSIHIKKTIVQEDELDTGHRYQLNLGHTFGHALETAGSYIRLHHGEAVGLGMLMALRASATAGILEEDYTEILQQLFKDFNLPQKVPEELEKKEILNTITQDKKKSHEGYTFVLPVKLGKVVLHKVAPEQIGAFISDALKNI